MSDKLTMAYVEEERARCAQLCLTLAGGPDKAFLIHCINYSVQPSEIDDRRTRYEEMASEDAGLEDLLS